VAERHRLAHTDAAGTPMQVIVKVGAANASGLDGNPNLIGSRGNSCRRLDPQILLSVNDNAKHRILPSFFRYDGAGGASSEIFLRLIAVDARKKLPCFASNSFELVRNLKY
jgi:hypothetical protein